ncbi:MAG: PAS domain S-box protein [Anaerolineales bacterium]|nr:PAS domain S-box protein [Anaerolineales bacterium]
MTEEAGRSHLSSEQRYRDLFELLPLCIFVVDAKVIPATFVDANQRAELVYGYSNAELMGMPARELVAEVARPAILTIMQRARQGQTVKAEVLNQRRDGTRFPGRIMVTPDPAQLDRMIVTVEDITAEKQRRSEADAIEAERRRISHEIHDGVAQNLAGLRFKSALWSTLDHSAPPEMHNALAELEATLVTAIADLRCAIFALRPLDLEQQGFFPALQQLVMDFGDMNQLAARLEITGPRDDLPAAYELPLYRIIQESLNNIRQHARAASVMIHVAVEPTGSVSVSVQDDGCGFDPGQLRPVDHAGHWG